MAWFDVISHAKLFFNFFTDQPRNPWHMFAEPLGSAKPRLKNTGLMYHPQLLQRWWTAWVKN